MSSVVLDKFYAPLRKKAETIQLASNVLFDCAQKGYLHSGRGAIFFLFQSEDELINDSDDTKYSYVHLSALLDVTNEPVWKLVQEYEPRQSFVLLLGVKMTAGEDVELAQLRFYTVVVNPVCVQKLQSQLVHNIVSRLATSAQPTHSNTDVHFCASTSCSNNGTLRCSRCQHVWYCSADCQLEDWRYHKPRCVKK